MKKIVLYGELGKKFGKYWNLDVQTPAEAVRAIIANKPEFAQHIGEEGRAYKVFTGRENIGEDKLAVPVSNKEVIRIVPVIMGAGAAGQIILGVVLIAVSYFTWWSGPVAAGIFKMGVAMIVSGVATALVQHFNKPKTPEETENPENKPSFAFGGAVNTIMQGGCVPLCYGGPIEIGSYVVSASIDSRDIPL